MTDHFISAHIAMGQRRQPRPGAKHIKVMNEVWARLREHDARFRDGIPPAMTASKFYKIVKVACKRLGKTTPPNRAIKAWRRKRS
jgi:hypothetical protein